ncbi:hypothetical protein CQ064_32925, partial [Bacillus sp. MYb78]
LAIFFENVPLTFHSWSFNSVHIILCFNKKNGLFINLLFYLYMIECFLLDIEFIQTMLIFKR